MTEKDNFRELFKLYSKEMIDYARGILKDKDEAKDAVQDVFIRYMDTYQSFREDCSIKTWLMVLTRNHCLKKLNGRAVSLLSLTDELEINNDEKITLKISVDDAMERLDSNEYEIIYLKDFAGYSYNEITSIMKISVDNVKVRLFRARQKLKKYLQ